MPPPVRRRPLAAACLAFGLALAVTGAAAAANGGFTPPAPRSENAERINDAYYFVLAFTAGVFVLVEASLIAFVVRFRGRGRGREVEGPQLRGNTSLELAWTVAPVLILAAIAGFVFYKLPGIKDVPSAQAADRLEVRVEGRLFYWRFVYPNGAVTIDRLYAPAGRVVELEVTSPANDVIHSWWVPALGGKIDTIPGQTNRTWFRAAKEGVYKGRCAEFCGIQHSAMLAAVEVMSPEEFDRWLAEQSMDRQALGKQEYEGVCAKCHGFEGEGGIGPPIAGNPLLSDPAGLEQLLREGRGAMPPVGTGWSDGQIEALVEYMERKIAGGG